MKNRKGFLLGEETLKIVIAVICIVFLVYFLLSLYLANKKGKDLEFAKASLIHLIDKINNKATQIEIYNPGGWYISSFPQEIKSSMVSPPEKIFPKSCSNIGWNNCICICETSLYPKKNIGELCDKNGFCLENDFIVEGEKLYKWQKTIDSITISAEPPLILTINHENKMISKIK